MIKDVRRKWKEIPTEIPAMPQELKTLLLSKMTPSRQTTSENIVEAIKTEDFKIDPKKFLLKNDGLEKDLI